MLGFAERFEATTACLIQIIWDITLLPSLTCPPISDCIGAFPATCCLHGFCPTCLDYCRKSTCTLGVAASVTPISFSRFFCAYISQRLASSQDLPSPQLDALLNDQCMCCSPAEFSGIIGLMTAQSLLRENLSVALVERKQLGAGATGAGELRDLMSMHQPSMHLLKDKFDFFRFFAFRGCVRAILSVCRQWQDTSKCRSCVPRRQRPNNM